MPENSESSDLIEEWELIDEELRELRKRRADWDFIRKLSPELREAIEVYIERGDLREAQHVADAPLDEFIEVLRRAKVWTG
ncbi:MAG: hypothetical protein LM591_05920 [Candidatus Korarchaeum sp.]|nr:hypothetical protein [Candidatus Korarchaeum sp.]